LFLLPPALALRHLPPFPTRRSSDLRKFPLGDAGRHGRDPARPSIGAPERIHYGAIVAAVTGGLNDDVALKPEVIPQAPELHLRRIARRVAALRGIGKLRAGPEHVTVSVH